MTQSINTKMSSKHRNKGPVFDVTICVSHLKASLQAHPNTSGFTNELLAQLAHSLSHCSL